MRETREKHDESERAACGGGDEIIEHTSEILHDAPNNNFERGLSPPLGVLAAKRKINNLSARRRSFS